MNIKLKPIMYVYPELADTTNIYRFIEFLNEDVQVFIKECYKHANYEINEHVNIVCEILMDYLVRKGHINPNTHRHSLVDCLLISALLHDVYYEGPNKPSTLFKAREEFTLLAKLPDVYEFGEIPDQILDATFQAIEEHLGDESNIQKLTPIPGSPSDMLATAVWIAKNMDRWQK
jgi:hypothetical protein